MDKNITLFEKLQELNRTDSYPFHMPGHKRQVEWGITSFPNPFSVDISEIDGFDNLHRPEGILKRAMERAATIYGADQTYYLVNGSSCGILSALCGSVSPGRRVIMARNSHKSAYHAVLLNRMDPEYIYPDYIERFGVQGGIAPESVERVLKGQQDIQAIFLTSPTYEGITSDVEKIAQIAHSHGIPLIVDEAHGAHFSFRDEEMGIFPRSALDCGADIVVQSVHKTLPSLTQTALLHVKSRLVDLDKIQQYLQIFQSSSPSYVLLASIDNCISYMEKQGKKRLSDFGGELRAWMKECVELKHLKLMGDEIVGTCHVQGRDLSKLVLSANKRVLTGVELADILREQHQIESEMSCSSYVLLMTSLMDTKEGLERLKKALFLIDKQLADREESARKKRVEEADVSENPEGDHCVNQDKLTWILNPVRRMSFFEASSMPSVYVDIKTAEGRISKGFITIYPPGIPAVVPGEEITKDVIVIIQNNRAEGLTVEGVSENGELWVVTEEIPAKLKK